MKILNSMAFSQFFLSFMVFLPSRSLFPWAKCLFNIYPSNIPFSILIKCMVMVFIFYFFFAALNERRKKRRQEKIMIYCNDKTVNSNANWICLPEISFQLCICRDPWLSKQIEQFKKNCIAYTRKPERCNLIRYWSLPLLHPFLYFFLFSLHANLYPNEIYFG